MPDRPLLDRAQLARIAQNVPQTIAGLEKLLSNVGAFPSTIEEANALAGSALAVAQVAMASLAALADALVQMEGAPAPLPPIEQDDTAPRACLGTIASQNADNVEVTGGAVDSTPIGSTTAAAGRFTTLATTDKFGCNGKAPQAAAALAGEAADLASAITLTNSIRAALIANGIGM